MQRLLDLCLVDDATPGLIYPVELLDEKISKLLVILDLLAHDSTKAALVDFVIVLADERVQENLVIQRINSCLFLLLLQHEEAREDAVLHRTMDEGPHLFLRQRPILYIKHKHDSFAEAATTQPTGSKISGEQKFAHPAVTVKPDREKV